MANLQKQFIRELINKEKFVCIFLNNGIKLRGYILYVDDECFILGGQSTQLVYKQAVATIVPEREVRHSSSSVRQYNLSTHDEDAA